MGLLPQFSVELSKGSSLSLRGNASRRSANADGNPEDDFGKALERAGTPKNADLSAPSQETPARDSRTADEPNSSSTALKKQKDKNDQDDSQAADDSSGDPTCTTAVAANQPTADQPTAASNDSDAAASSTDAESKKPATDHKDAGKSDDSTGANVGATAAAGAAGSSTAAQTAAIAAAKTAAATAGEVAATVPQLIDASHAPKAQPKVAPEKAANIKAVADDKAQSAGSADTSAEKDDVQLKPAVSRQPELKGNSANSHGAKENGHQQQTAADPTQAATSTISPTDLAREILNTDADAAAAAQPATEQPSAAASEKGTPAVNVLATTAATNTNKQADSSSASSASSAQDSPSPDSQQTFDQVVLGLKGKFDARTGKAEIRLDPPNLGVLKVSVTLENGSLTAEFQSPSDVVRSLLNDNLDKLKTVLESQGVAVDKLAVNQPVESAATQQGGTQSGNFGSATHDGRSAGHYQQDPRSPRRSDADGFARVLKKTTAPLDLVA